MTSLGIRGRRAGMSRDRAALRSGWRAIAGLLALVLLASCAGEPKAEPALSEAAIQATTPRLVGPDGPLGASESTALIQRISAEAGDHGALMRQLSIEQAIAKTPLMIGNRTRVLRDGPQTFAAIFAAIRSARSSINMEYYILENVESGGVRLADLLLAKRRQGVRVNVIYDGFGSAETPAGFFKKLANAGVRFLEFHPLDPFAVRTIYAPNDRDHRKILIVDGRLAIIGGVNLSTSYESSAARANTSPGASPETWRDTDLEIQGPAVAQLQRLFVRQWTAQKGPALDRTGFFPALRPAGSQIVRIIGSTPGQTIRQYYATLLSAIQHARKRVWLSAAYFVPTHEEMEALTGAARRGVDVRLLLPDHSNSELAIAVAHSRYGDLLEAGVTIYETHGIVLHSKTITIDGVWSVIGSSNFDHRSVLFNDEVDAVVLGSKTAQALERIFEDDLKDARRIDSKAWARRPVWLWLTDHVARLWQALL